MIKDIYEIVKDYTPRHHKAAFGVLVVTFLGSAFYFRSYIKEYFFPTPVKKEEEIVRKPGLSSTPEAPPNEPSDTPQIPRIRKKDGTKVDSTAKQPKYDTLRIEADSEFGNSTVYYCECSDSSICHNFRSVHSNYSMYNKIIILPILPINRRYRIKVGDCIIKEPFCFSGSKIKIKLECE